MCYEIEIITKKKPTINHEVQSPINQVLKDEIREKTLIFFKRKKNTLWLKPKLSGRNLASITRIGQDSDRDEIYYGSFCFLK
jgi:phosphoribosyl-AMP cyclohydrolase